MMKIIGVHLNRTINTIMIETNLAAAADDESNERRICIARSVVFKMKTLT